MLVALPASQIKKKKVDVGVIIYLEMCNDRGESGQRPQHAPIPGASPSPANSTLLFLSNTAGLASEHTYFLENTYFRP